jgi:hypothetical protein
MTSKAYIGGQSQSWHTVRAGITAVNCQTGDLLAQEQATADSKEPS